jgi:hypothetical protein
MPELKNLTGAGTKIDWRNRNKGLREAMGLCRVCAEPLAPNSKNYCLRHLAIALERKHGDRVLRRKPKLKSSDPAPLEPDKATSEFESAPPAPPEKPFYRR